MRTAHDRWQGIVAAGQGGIDIRHIVGDDLHAEVFATMAEFFSGGDGFRGQRKSGDAAVAGVAEFGKGFDFFVKSLEIACVHGNTSFVYVERAVDNRPYNGTGTGG
jgi:hypothetical protein